MEVLGGRAETFAVAGHHYALVQVEGLAPAAVHDYDVVVDGRRAWPEPGGDAGRIRTRAPGGPLRVAFGSCRVAAPHEPPWTTPAGSDPAGRGPDALAALAHELRAADPATWPDLLLLLGDQVYADDTSPGVRAFIRERRDVAVPPGEEVADFEEYTRLYRESWSDPTVGWLLANVPSAMIFDDHDVHDDWNTSAAWVAAMHAEPWWAARIAGAIASYWVYQHLGNLPPEELAADDLYARVRGAGDAWPLLRDAALAADRDPAARRWSYHRDFGATRLLVIDSRCARVLDPGRRSMVDAAEWAWVEERARGDFDHLLLATSLPFALGPAAHHLEAWNEAVCDGAWGRAAARAGERLRQAIDLEHWAAFHDSFGRFAALIADVGAGRRGRPPGSVAVLSGDVHHTYLARLRFPRSARVRSPAWQVVCSPLRNQLRPSQQAVHRRAFRRPAAAAARALARSAGVGRDAVRWRVVRGPWFDNHVGLLELDGRAATLTVRRAVPTDAGGAPAALEPLYRHPLSR